MPHPAEARGADSAGLAVVRVARVARDCADRRDVARIGAVVPPDPLGAGTRCERLAVAETPQGGPAHSVLGNGVQPRVR